MLEGMKFAVGPTIVAREIRARQMGGFDRLKDYLAEDFVMGKFAAELGYRVLLSSYVIEHHIGSQDLAANLQHRLRWARSTRRSRPAGYVGRALHDAPAPGAAADGLGAGALAGGDAVDPASSRLGLGVRGLGACATGSRPGGGG